VKVLVPPYFKAVLKSCFEALRSIDPAPAHVASDENSSYHAWPVLSKIAAALEFSNRFFAFKMSSSNVPNSPQVVSDYLELLLVNE
jgi:hypothetical protein